MEPVTFVELAKEWVKTGNTSGLKEKYPPNPRNELFAMCVITSAQKEVSQNTHYGVPSHWLK